MAIIPKIPKEAFSTKKCALCGSILDSVEFAHTHSIFYPDHKLPVCNSCISRHLSESDYSWDAIDKICQWADIPFIVKEWERIASMNKPENVWAIYAKVFADNCYQNFGWADYQKQYRTLRETGFLEQEIPLLDEKYWDNLRRKWGSNYDNDALLYLEDLYKGLLVS